MSCPSCSENSSTTYSRCNPPVSTNCVFYQGSNLTCSYDEGFTICKGQNMSSVQEEIFNRICQLIGDTDVSKVKIPCDLGLAWDGQDATILNYFNYLLDVACIQKAAIATLSAGAETVDPLVTIYKPCPTNCQCEDLPTVTVKLSDALNDIIKCLCNAKAEIKTLQENLLVLENDVKDIKSVYTQFSSFITTQTALNVSNAVRLTAIEGKTNCLPDC